LTASQPTDLNQQQVLVNWYENLVNPGSWNLDLALDICENQTATWFVCDGNDPQNINALYGVFQDIDFFSKSFLFYFLKVNQYLDNFLISISIYDII